MTKKIISIFLSLLLTASVAASVVACGDKKGGNTETGNINVGTGEEGTTVVGTDSNGQPIYGPSTTEIGDPGEYSYTECDETVYVNNPDSEVTLRSADYVAMGSLKHGAEIKRIGVSTDAANYWSKIVYNGETYYMASKFITTMQNPTEGFVDADKTVYISPKTGSLNIRNIPSMEGSIVGHAVSGVAIKVVAENTTTGWYKIEFTNADKVKAYGYIASDAKYYETSAPQGGATTEAGTTAGTTSDEGAPEGAGK